MNIGEFWQVAVHTTYLLDFQNDSKIQSHAMFLLGIRCRIGGYKAREGGGSTINKERTQVAAAIRRLDSTS